GTKAGIAGKLWHAGNPRIFAELTLIADRDDEEAILRGEGLVGHDIGMGIAQALRRLAADQEIERLVGKHRNLGIEQSEVEILPLAGLVAVVEGVENADRGIKAGEHVG